MTIDTLPKNPLDGLTPAQQQAEIDRARLVLRKSSEYVIDGLTEKNEQLCTLANAITNALTPPDEKNPPDDWPLTAWRLAQVLEGLLGHQYEITAARSFLLGRQ